MENHARLTQALGLLADALAPYLERELKRTGAGWWTERVLPNVSPEARQRLPARPKQGVTGQLGGLDAADLLQLLVKNFAMVFRGRLPETARSYAEELRSVRNQWAHKPAKGDLDGRMVSRALDTAALLLDGIDRSAAEAVRALLADAGPGTGGQPADPAANTPPAWSPADAGLRPWREVVTPRPDVRTGTLTQGQFAADLHEVYRGNPEVGRDYLDPREFFERTYVTAGLRSFLKVALQRLTGKGGDPVVQLKTGFGGGKTHTMLALYHMARSGAEIVDDVPVLKELSQELGVPIPKANTAVLVGTKISATAPYDDDPELRALGISLKTLWGHMAWQLGGWKAYQVVQVADETGVAPGEELRNVLRMASPCIILMDEMVAYGRNLPTTKGKVPGGTLESLLTFLQTLTEMAKSTPGVIVAASIPESDYEIGGVQGERVLARVQQTFGRLETAWQPVQPMESFEVVRRRLFERVPGDARDQAVAAFIRYYRENREDFPPEVQEREYEERMRAAYPFHPELFDRLYLDWNGAVPTFQSTRGVLRLLAAAVQAMWQEQDSSALIMPATVRFDLPVIREELMRHLPAPFQSVIDSDIEGPSAEAVRIDAENPRFGKVGAARALARTILLGSVPGKVTPGIEDVRIRLGAARPGEPIATYNDALGRLRERLQYLHGTGSRYWFEVRPNLNRTVADRMSRISLPAIEEELARRLRKDTERSCFAGKHVAPASHAEVPDDAAVRLVVIPPSIPHRPGPDDSPAVAWAREVLNNRGTVQRLNRNMLVFAAFDEEQLAPLRESVKSYLAWKSVVDESTVLRLDENQVRQAKDALSRADGEVDTLLSNGYRWVLAPAQAVNRDEGGRFAPEPETFRAVDMTGRLGSTGSLAVRVSSALQQEELLLETWSPLSLQRELDRWFWSRGLEHINAKQLWEEYLTRYLYFPRLRDREVLIRTIQEGATKREFFGYAMGEAGGAYVGLSFGERPGSVVLDDSSLIVRKDVAEAALAAREPQPVAADQQEPGPAEGGVAANVSAPSAAQPHRFYGSVKLDPLRLASAAGQVGEELVSHLNGLLGAEVEVVLEVRAAVPGGIPEDVRRIVGENARALKFSAFEFED